MVIDQSDIRFGWVAVQKGFVTPQQVVDALVSQVKENFHTGEHTRIGEIFLRQGLMSRSQIDEVLLALEKSGQRR